MKFDYTYITLGSFRLFEPMILLTNAVFFIVALVFFRRLRRMQGTYARYMSGFVLLLGCSTLAGALAHAVHYDLGITLFKSIFLVMSACSLFAMYFIFLGSMVHVRRSAAVPDRIRGAVTAYVFAALILCIYSGKFVLIEINGGVALVYTLWAHRRLHHPDAPGNKLVVWGIAAAFASIIAHLAGLSFGKWFNEKDVAHVIMIGALFLLGNGAVRNSRAVQR